MKTRIFNLIILDESGSMQSIKQAAINGMNETVQSIKASQKDNPVEGITKPRTQLRYLVSYCYNVSDDAYHKKRDKRNKDNDRC
jgi:hypothetical protein